MKGKNSYRNIIIVNALIFFILFIFIEIALKVTNFKPLSYYLPIEIKNDLINHNSDSVKLLPFYYPDSLGLQKIDLSKYDSNVVSQSNWHKDLYNYIKDSKFNEEGFRTNSFINMPLNKTRIMFIGDSYVFGYEANPITNSFVDIIQRRDTNLYCLNLGIGSLDLAGYEAIAKNYIPKLKPNIVACFIYVNDFIFYNKKMESYKINDVFLTYQGVLLKENNNYSKNHVQVYETENDAYLDFKSKINFFTSNNSNSIKRFLFNNSRIYSLLKRIRINSCKSSINYKLYKKENTSPLYLKTISEVCKKNNAKLLVFLIPNLNNKTSLTEREYYEENLKSKEKLYYPENLNASDYVGPYQHFNNKGYKKYADFVYNILDSLNLIR